MKTRLIVMSLFLIFGCVRFSSAQKVQADMFHDENGNTYHQVFLDFHITELIEIRYASDGAPVEGELSTDGYSVIIKNYPGDRSVKLVIKDDNGQQKELTKSRCAIDPVILQL